MFDKLWHFFKPLRTQKGNHYGDFLEDMEVTSRLLDILIKWYFHNNPQETDLPD